MSSLTDRLRARIQSEGAISFHDFMATALYDQEAGYYCRERERWGRAGDYRTSPERSRLFAATFANYFSRLHQKLGSPSAWVLVETGAGAGVFAESVLETLSSRSPEVFKGTRYVIDERSSTSRALAGQRLARFGSQVEFARLEDLPPVAAGIVFSNELLDAFPVHRVTVLEGELFEFFVAINGAGEFVWNIKQPATSELRLYFEAAGVRLREGQIAEVNLAARSWIHSAAKVLQRGYLVTVDYGAEAQDLYSASDRPAGTLRGFAKHKLSDDVLASPGGQDITSSVNWSDVIRAGEAAGLKTISFERQDQFLMREGLLEELERQVQKAGDESERIYLRTNAREMILPNGMAASFQVLVQEKR
jgi:SAM-dependent MidA family methyltransferase